MSTAHLYIMQYGADTHYRTYGPYIRVHFWHPYLRPYVQVSKSSPVYTACTSHRKVPEYILANINYVTTDSFCNQNILNSTNIRCCGIKKSRSRRDNAERNLMTGLPWKTYALTASTNRVRQSVSKNKNSSGDEIANVNFCKTTTYMERPAPTPIEPLLSTINIYGT